MQYILYARKSTDAEDRQVLSIEAQLAELKEYARREKLEIVDVLVESKTAKRPGRGVFNEMTSRIERGEADGIIAWNPDRLARNAVDGGHIINLIDIGKLRALKFPTYWFEPSSQGLFMLQIAFGQAKYFIDNLSENVKRGLRQKVRRGEYPGRPPLGYVNDLRTHVIKVDKKTAPVVRKLFSLYATGKYTLKDLAAASRELGVVTWYKKGGLAPSVVHRLLTNPFYVGLFTYYGELHEGKHTPLIDKATFDLVQRTIKNRSKPRKSKQPYSFPYRGLFRCAECGRAITTEQHRKKSGLLFRYYRCTKKGTLCHQPYINETNLQKQVSEIISNVALSQAWNEKMLHKCEEWEQEQNHACARAVADLSLRSADIRKKLSKLLDAHLDGALDTQEYREKKAQLLGEKVSCEQKLAEINRTGHQWLEPLKKWIHEAHHAQELAFSDSEAEKASFLARLGSNRALRGGTISLSFRKPWQLLAERAFQKKSAAKRGGSNRSYSSWQGWRESNPR